MRKLLLLLIALPAYAQVPISGTLDIDPAALRGPQGVQGPAGPAGRDATISYANGVCSSGGYSWPCSSATAPIPPPPAPDPAPVPAPPPAPTPAPPPASGDDPDITARMAVEYVGLAGNVLTAQAAVGSSPVITGYAPLAVFINATETRSTVANTRPLAWLDIGYLWSFGEGRGTRWPLSRESMDYEHGAPIAGYVYERPGIYTLQMRVRDKAGNEETVSAQVDVRSMPVQVLTSLSGLQSGRHYGLQAGVAYGSLDTSGLRNVVFSKVGDGANPSVSRLNVESRSPTASDRATGVRLVNVDVGEITYGPRGFDHVSVVRGRLRAYTFYPMGWTCERAPVSERPNYRYYKGLLLWEVGEINQLRENYAIIDDVMRGAHILGSSVVKNGNIAGASGSSHALRAIMVESTVRHSRIDATVGTQTWGTVKVGGLEAHDGVPDEMRADGRVCSDSGNRFEIPTTHTTFERTQFGSAQTPSNVSQAPSYAPQNNDNPWPDEGVQESSFERNWFPGPSLVGPVQGIDLGGRALSSCENRTNGGSGSHVSANQNKNINNIPQGWRGPYRDEAQCSRPRPAPF